MGLSNELISQFVRITNDNKDTKKETTVYGVVDASGTSVLLDGYDPAKPIGIPIWTSNARSGEEKPSNTTVHVEPGDRVTLLIKNHTAIITGNLGKPAANEGYVKQTINDNIGTIKDMVIDSLDAQYVEVEVLNARLSQLNHAIIDHAEATYLKATEIDVEELEADHVKISDLEVENVEIKGKLEADEGRISELEADNLKINNQLEADQAILESLDATYANIDFSNINQAAMASFYANSGIIKDVVLEEGTITGTLVGVTITGDLIEGNTIKADKLVIKGEDGMYYKLNTDGMSFTEAEQTDANSLNGSVIQARSITASKISVSDLVAFDATIGGFSITDSAIYSEVKDSENNVTRGIYLDSDGQINFGDSTNYIKYYRDDSGAYRLAISAESIMYALNGKQYSLSDLGHIGEYVHIGTYEGEPCIELGESDSDFRLVITNTKIMFMDGTTVPAYVNNQSLHITKAVVEEEIQQGQFVWKIRQNGNLGLMWINS